MHRSTPSNVRRARTAGKLPLALASLLFASSVRAAGTDVAVLVASPAVTAADLIAQTSAPVLAMAEASTKPPAAMAQRQEIVYDAAVDSGVTLESLLAADAMPLGELVSESHADLNLAEPARDVMVAAAPAAAAGTLPYTYSSKPTATPAGVATKLPKATKSKPKDLTVRVQIPAEPNAKPIAARVDPAAPKAGGDIVVKAAPSLPVAPAKAPAVTVAKEQTAAPVRAPLNLEVAAGPSGLKLTPESLRFEAVGQSGKIDLKVAGATLFVRDQHVVTLDRKTNELFAHQRGSTELYVVDGGRMYIVPVTVEDAARWDLKVPDALISLDGVMTASAAAAGPYTAPETAPSLTASVAETVRAMDAAAKEATRFVQAAQETQYKPVTIQVLDERSNVAAGRIFPAANVQVHVVGTEFAAKTDHTGHLTIRDMPADARFLVRLDDTAGSSVRPGVAELWTGGAGDKGVVRMKVMRNFTFDSYQNLAGVAQNAGLGSVCATVLDAEQDRTPVAGVSVSLDATADGPYYVNQYGFLDRSVAATGPDGRVCLFNVAPGPLAVSLFAGDGYLATLPVATFAGRHVEHELVLNGGRTLTTRLATVATAHEQLGGDLALANSYRTIDMIDMIPLGTDDPMMQLGPGLVQTSNELLPVAGRVRAFARAAEFEPTVYSYDTNARSSVTPLLPRGFVEDMSVYAQVSHDPSLGTVLVEYGHEAGVEQGAGSISLRLTDEHGRDVGDGWYFSDAPTTKAIFFNVPAGQYSLMVETSDQFWLGAETVMVYNETVSYVRTGSPIRYRP